MAEQQKITIDNQEYVLDDLSDNAKAQLANLRVVDAEISRLQQQMAIAQTARNSYASVLRSELDQ